MEVVLRQPPGFGPGTLRVFTTYSIFPSALTLTELGYHPVGIKPRTIPPGKPARDSFCIPSVNIAAIEFAPPFATYNVFSSGESARLFGLLPMSRRGFEKMPDGAVVPTDAIP